MKTILRAMAAASAAVLLSACALLTDVVGDSTTNTVKRGAEASLLVIRDGWIPALKAYRSLPQCGQPAQPPCWDPELYAKLYNATDAVTLCMQQATRSELTLVGYQACEAKFNKARAAFSSIPSPKGTI